MSAEVVHPGMLPDTVVTPVVIAMAGAATAAWIASHLFLSRPKSKAGRLGLFILRVGVGGVAVWLALNALRRFLLFENPWPIWIPSLLGGAAVEIVLALYRLERERVSRRAGIGLVAIRLVLALLVVFMLVQPVFSWDERRQIDRYVAVLLDESASMRIADTQLTASEKLGLAEVFHPGLVERPYRLEAALLPLRRVSEKLGGQVDLLALLHDASFSTLRRQLKSHAGGMRDLFAESQRAIGAARERLAKAEDSGLDFAPRTRKNIEDARAALDGVRDELKKAAGTLDDDGDEETVRRYRELLARVRDARVALLGLLARWPVLAGEVDAAYVRSLPEETRRGLDAAARTPRCAIARAVLTAQRGDRPPLVRTLGETYGLKAYRFSAEAEAIEPGYLEEDATEPVDDGPGQEATDLAAALRRAAADVPPGKLAGVLVLTDGRHNTKADVEPVARRLGAQDAPVCTVLVGSREPPFDAAVTGVVAPRAVFAEDRLVMEVGLKFDGLRGKDVHVKLLCGEEQLAEQSLRVPADHFRTIANLADTPTETGIRAYRIEVEQFEGEVTTHNNVRPVNVAVTRARTNLLIIEGRPRWEFRYLRNLFVGRDKTVQLQHVLLQPDWITDAKRPELAASVALAEEGQGEATALPATEEQWLRFDVILIGDVSPTVLHEEQVAILKKFVGERGGTLIFIAGPRHMPHAYGGSELGELLPVRFEPAQDFLFTAPEPGFYVALTRAGRDHVVTRQSDVREENVRLWDARPVVRWRHPGTSARKEATVLAYAMPEERPGLYQADEAVGRVRAEQREKARRAFERDHALVVIQNRPPGKVMMLTFDRTWRLRYRVGDTYHHKFWGQVMRWARPDKLQAGTDRVQLGTSRALYGPDEAIPVQAKIIGPDRAPVVTDDAGIHVYQDGQHVLFQRLACTAPSAGRYETVIAPGALPPGGRYRIELASREADQILAAEGAGKVDWEVMVLPERTSELIDLSADRRVPERAARLTGGAVTRPAAAAGLIERFGPGTREVLEPRPYLVWNSWPLLLIMVVLATNEWIVRKKVGLA
ncbi:MAG: hypothetical protein R6V58_01785 [Planctomycetota bacterium]